MIKIHNLKKLFGFIVKTTLIFVFILNTYIGLNIIFDNTNYDNITNNILNQCKNKNSYIFVIDEYEHNNLDWHGKLILKHVDDLFSQAEDCIIPINVASFFKYKISINNQKNNIYLYNLVQKLQNIKHIKSIGINKSFIESNAFMNFFIDLNLIKNNKVFISNAANFKKEKFENINESMFNYIGQFNAIKSQVVFFLFFKYFFDEKQYIFNLNTIHNDLYLNNFLFFYNNNTQFFNIEEQLSTSSATPYGLKKLLQK